MKQLNEEEIEKLVEEFAKKEEPISFNRGDGHRHFGIITGFIEGFQSCQELNVKEVDLYKELEKAFIYSRNYPETNVKRFREIIKEHYSLNLQPLSLLSGLHLKDGF
jgi:hypothetical protein